MSYLSVSTWSLHRLLGPLNWTTWDEASKTHRTMVQEQPQVLTLLELPQAAADRGYKAIEVCHFHFPSMDRAYLDQLRNSFAQAGVSFDTLLLDYGDLTSKDVLRVEADMAFIHHWIEAASICGAKQIRIIAGEAAPSDQEALQRSAASLSELIALAAPHGVRIITENFKPLTSMAANCLYLRSTCGEALGLITDFGNYHSNAKYEEISQTTHFSVSVHAKPQYNAHGEPDRDELQRCLDAVKETGFDGAFVLIYDGPGDMWEGLERVKVLVEPYVS